MDTEKKDKREAILRATLELVAEHGFHGSPTAMIAERAGVGIGTIYRYFADKDMLIYEVHRELELKIFGFILSGYQDEDSYRQQFICFCTVLLQYLIDNPMEFRFMEQFFNSPYGVALRRDRIFAEAPEGENTCIMKDLYEQGRAQRLIKDIPLLIFFALVFGPIIAVARDHILGFITLDDNQIGAFVEACWDSVKK